MGYIDGLVQERRNSSALAMELRLSCTNPSICYLLQSLKLVVIRMPSSFITGVHNCCSVSDDKVGILTTLSFQCYGQYWPADISYTSLQDHQKKHFQFIYCTYLIMLLTAFESVKEVLPTHYRMRMFHKKHKYCIILCAWSSKMSFFILPLARDHLLCKTSLRDGLYRKAPL